MRTQIKCIDCILNKMVALELEDHVIVSKKYTDDPLEGNLYIGPGLVDLQVNGFASVDFNEYPISEKDFLKVISALAKEGVTSFFPTIITNSDEAIISLLKNVDALCLGNTLIADFVGGIHLEGPFISPEPGARGAHDAKYIKAPDWDLFLEFQKASGHRIKIVTISPEWENASTFIQKAAAENIIVSIGHTVASPAQVRTAVAAGARMSTHLGNGAPLLLSRNDNFIFEQLVSNNLATSIIADGFHLPDAFLKMVFKMKGDAAILVSDSTKFAGMEAGTYETHIGGKVVLDKNNRLATFENENILAGAAVSILDCINKLLESGLADLKDAWSMASVHPNKLLGQVEEDDLTLDHSDLVLFKMENCKVVVTNIWRNTD